MENWSFPARYDEDYLPAAGERYWFKTRETMPAGERERAILERLQVVCAYAYEHAPFYKRKWDDAGFHPSKLKSLEDFEKIPVVQKKDLRESQTRDAAVRRLSLRAGERSVSYSWHQRHDRAADRLCHRPQRLAHDCECACAHHVGHGPAAGRHDLRGRDLLALYGKLGRARGRGAAWARNVFRSAPACRACRRAARNGST